MLELVVSICLAATPDACAERWLPGVADCPAEGAARAAAWAAERPGLRLAGWRCAAEGAAPLSVSEIAPGVFVHEGDVALADAANGGDIANLGFVVGEEAVAVIDAGGSRAVAEGLLAAIRRETSLPVRWLILTHMHPDHVFGAGLFREAGAEILAHPKFASALALREETYAERLRARIGEAAFLGAEPASPDRPAEGGERLELGGRSLLLEAWPTGHTDNDLSALDLATGTFFAGDLVFAEHVPTLDGSLRGWIGALEALAGRADIARIVPGHGPAALPHPGGLAPQFSYLRGLAAEARAAINRGEALSAFIGSAGEALGEGWRLNEEFRAGNATAAYVELEWE